MKKILIMSLIMCLLIGSSTFATSGKTIVASELNSVEKEIIEIYKGNDTKIEKDEKFKKLFSEKSNRNVLVENAKLKEKKEYLMEDGSKVIFSNDGTFGIQTLTAVESPQTKTISGSNYTMSGSNYTTTHRVEYTARGGTFANELYTIWTEGYFEYDGINTPTPYLVDSGYSRTITGSLWQVANWSEGTIQMLNNKEAYTYASGLFNIGVAIQGQGFVVQDFDTTVKLMCNKDGIMWGDTVIID